MKKFFISFLAIAAAASALVSCNKEIENTPVTPSPKDGYQYSFTIVKENTTDGTKSFLQEDGVVWEDTDIVGMFISDGDSDLYSGSAAVTPFDGENPAKVSITSRNEIPAGSLVYAYFPYDESNTDKASTKLVIPNVQDYWYRDEDSDAGVSAMPLAGLPFEVETAISVEDETYGEIRFMNLGSVIEFNVYSENSADEIIESITFTGGDSDIISGEGFIDLTTVEEKDDIALDFTNSSTVYNYATATVSEETLVSESKDAAKQAAMLVVAPGTYNCVISVVTNQATYTFPAKNVTLNRGRIKHFYMNLDNATREEAEPKYVKVTSTDELTNGNYLIVYETGGVAFNGGLSTLDAASNTISVTIVDNEIEATEATDAAVFTIDVAEGTILSASGFYIGKTAYSNGLDAKTTALTNTFSFDEDGNAVITASGNCTLRYNSDSGQTRFRYYKTGQKAIQLYKRVGGELPSVTWNLTGIEITTAPTKVEYFIGDSFDPTGMVVTATYVDADDPAHTKTEEVDNTALTFEPSGALTADDTEVTITYEGKTATLEITVTEVSYDFTTVAELNDLVSSTSGTYYGYLTDAIVSFVPATNTAIVKDATGSVMYYKSGHGLKQGQTFTGAIEVTAILYNSQYSEITAMDATFAGSGATVEPESISLSDLIGNYSAMQNAYVQVSGLTITSIDGTGNKDIHVTDGTNTYVVYYNPGNPTCGVGDVITVEGTVTKYSTTEEIKVWSADDITVTGAVAKAITFSQPTDDEATAGCSIKVIVDGNEITSGTTVDSGKTVTLEATAGTGYTFESWTVKGATVVDASESTTTFTMGISEVTVSASFSNGETPTSVSYDFTGSDWTVSNGTLSNGTVSFTGEGSGSFKMNTGYFMLGKTNAYITFPTYKYPVSKIVVTGRSGASASVVQNIYVDNTAVSTATTGATGENTYEIASDYQAAGTVYTLKVTSNHNTQITKIEVFFN